MLVSSFGCGDSEAESEETETEEAESHYEPPVEVTRTERPRSAARVVRTVGERSAHPLFRAGQRIEANTTIETGLQGLVLDLREGARVEVAPGSEARIGEEARAQVVVAEGQVGGELPPQGSSPRPPLRIATPSGTIEIGGSGKVWVLVRPDGAAWLAVTGGQARVLRGDDDEEPLLLRPGRAVVIGQEPTQGPETQEAARAAAEALRDDDATPPEDALEEAMAALTEALTAAEAVLARGEELQQQHRQAVSAMAPNASELQREIVGHAQALSRARGLLRTRFERARAWSLLVDADPEPTGPVRQRVRAALGLESAE